MHSLKTFTVLDHVQSVKTMYSLKMQLAQVSKENLINNVNGISNGQSNFNPYDSNIHTDFSPEISNIHTDFNLFYKVSNKYISFSPHH